MVPEHSPKPTSPDSSEPHTPEMVMLSPSSKNFRSSPPFNLMVSFPPLLHSSKLPSVPVSVPLIVPDPRRSPTAMGQPPMEWWANICAKENSKFRPLELRRLVVGPPAAVQITESALFVLAREGNSDACLRVMSTCSLMSYRFFSSFSWR